MGHHDAAPERHRLSEKEAFAVHAAAASRDYAINPRLGEHFWRALEMGQLIAPEEAMPGDPRRTVDRHSNPSFDKALFVSKHPGFARGGARNMAQMRGRAVEPVAPRGLSLSAYCRRR